jgi:hypothetical protein
MALYALDALLFLLLMLFAADTGLLIAVAFHAYALFQIFRGYQACARVAELDKAAFVAPPPPPAPQSMS